MRPACELLGPGRRPGAQPAASLGPGPEAPPVFQARVAPSVGRCPRGDARGVLCCRRLKLKIRRRARRGCPGSGFPPCLTLPVDPRSPKPVSPKGTPPRSAGRERVCARHRCQPQFFRGSPHGAGLGSAGLSRGPAPGPDRHGAACTPFSRKPGWPSASGFLGGGAACPSEDQEQGCPEGGRLRASPKRQGPVCQPAPLPPSIRFHLPQEVLDATHADGQAGGRLGPYTGYLLATGLGHLSNTRDGQVPCQAAGGWQ